MAVIEQADKAVRLARAIASDISLYNEAKIKEGIGQDTLFEAIAAELDEGRELYKTRVSQALDPQGHFYWHAVVNIIVRSKGHLPSKIW
jgi:hypothetical protein